jgi:hypothetical protein
MAQTTAVPDKKEEQKDDPRASCGHRVLSKAFVLNGRLLCEYCYDFEMVQSINRKFLEARAKLRDSEEPCGACRQLFKQSELTKIEYSLGITEGYDLFCPDCFKIESARDDE